MLTPDELAAAAAGMRRLLAAAEAGELAATTEERAYLAGAVEALARLAPPKG